MAKAKGTGAAKGGAKKAAQKPGKPSAQDADLARKIWLAGVGAYDRMYNETPKAAGKIAKSATDAFHQLVAKGEEVEEQLRARLATSPRAEKLSSLMEAWAGRAQKLTEEQAAALQAQFEKVSKSVGQSLAPWNVAALGQAVEKLSAEVAALSAEVKAMKASRPAAGAKPPARPARTKAAAPK
jgi:uncharacterized small protein (DUF1192 family)